MKREYEKQREATAVRLIICERKIENRIELHALAPMSSAIGSKALATTFCALPAEGWKIRYPSSEAPLSADSIECADCRKAFKRAEKKAQQSAQQSR